MAIVNSVSQKNVGFTSERKTDIVDVISTMLIIYNDAVGKQVLKSVAFRNGNHDRC